MQQDSLSEAETELAHALIDWRYQLNNEKELVLLNQSEHKLVRTTMRKIADKYHGRMFLSAQELENERAAHKQETKIQELTHENAMSNEKSKLALLEQQISRQTDTMELRMRVLALEKDRRIAELEEANRLLSKNFPEGA